MTPNADGNQTHAAADAPVLSPADDDLPPGNHALEIAARRGIGPLSPSGREVWHGNTKPCVSCGQLVPRDDDECDQCGQDLRERMLDTMRAYAGPWYVLEHVRPFPGVRFERLVRQIHRGVLTETSIVRGPTTDHQWCFAAETPGLSKYFGRCWHCHGQVEPTDTHCPSCLTHLDGILHAAPLPKRQVGPGRSPGQASRSLAPAFWPVSRSASASDLAQTTDAAPQGSGTPTLTQELRELSEVVGSPEVSRAAGLVEDPPRIAGLRAIWVVSALLVVFVIVLVAVVRMRQAPPPPGRTSPADTNHVLPLLQPSAKPAGDTGSPAGDTGAEAPASNASRVPDADHEETKQAKPASEPAGSMEQPAEQPSETSAGWHG